MRPISTSLVVLLALALTTGWAFSDPAPSSPRSAAAERVLDHPVPSPDAQAGLLQQADGVQPGHVAPVPAQAPDPEEEETSLEVRRGEATSRGLTIPVPDLKESTWGY